MLLGTMGLNCAALDETVANAGAGMVDFANDSCGEMSKSRADHDCCKEKFTSLA